MNLSHYSVQNNNNLFLLPSSCRKEFLRDFIVAIKSNRHNLVLKQWHRTRQENALKWNFNHADASQSSMSLVNYLSTAISGLWPVFDNDSRQGSAVCTPRGFHRTVVDPNERWNDMSLDSIQSCLKNTYVYKLTIVFYIFFATDD